MDAIALSGMRAASQAMRSSAHNIANMQTPGFRRETVTMTAQADGGVAASVSRSESQSMGMAMRVEADMVQQLQARNAFLANLAVFRTNSNVRGSLVDMYA